MKLTISFLSFLAGGIIVGAVIYLNKPPQVQNQPNCILTLDYQGISEQCRQNSLEGNLSAAHTGTSGSVLAEYYRDIGTTLSSYQLKITAQDAERTWKLSDRQNFYQ